MILLLKNLVPLAHFFTREHPSEMSRPHDLTKLISFNLGLLTEHFFDEPGLVQIFVFVLPTGVFVMILVEGKILLENFVVMFFV